MNANGRALKWMTAMVLLAGFLLAFFLDLTGLAWHQWLGVGLGAVAAYHGWVHRAWIAATAGRLLSPRAGGLGRLYFGIDAALLAGLAVSVGTGLVISTWLDLALTAWDAWLNVHIWSALLTLALVVVKIGTHWRWVVSATRAQWDGLRQALGGEALAPARQPVAVAAAGPARSRALTRRDFLGVMGIVSLAAVVASLQTVEGLQAGVGSAAEVDSSATEADTAAAETSATETATSSTNTTTACTVLCNKRCSYPGQCRKYTDTNGNGKCDRGECA